VFVSGTAAEVIALREIDFRKIGSGTTGPITERLQRAFTKVVRGKHRLSAGWLEYVKSDRLPAASEGQQEGTSGHLAEAN